MSGVTTDVRAEQHRPALADFAEAVSRSPHVFGASIVAKGQSQKKQEIMELSASFQLRRSLGGHGTEHGEGNISTDSARWREVHSRIATRGRMNGMSLFFRHVSAVRGRVFSRLPRRKFIPDLIRDGHSFAERTVRTSNRLDRIPIPPKRNML